MNSPSNSLIVRGNALFKEISVESLLLRRKMMVCSGSWIQNLLKDLNLHTFQHTTQLILILGIMLRVILETWRHTLLNSINH